MSDEHLRVIDRISYVVCSVSYVVCRVSYVVCSVECVWGQNDCDGYRLSFALSKSYISVTGDKGIGLYLCV